MYWCYYFCCLCCIVEDLNLMCIGWYKNFSRAKSVVAEESVVSGSQMMARWAMTTTNAITLGSKQEVKKVGMLCARFNTAHKIVVIELMFDVMAFMLQLKQSARASTFTVIPNTVQTCVAPFGNYPMVITLADRPYTIVQVNEQLCMVDQPT